MIGLAGLAGYAGWTLARGEPQGFIFEARAIPAARRMRPLRRRAHHAARRRPHQCRSPAPPADSTRRPLSRACRRERLPIPGCCLPPRSCIGLPLGLAAGGSLATALLAAAAGAAADRDARREWRSPFRTRRTCSCAIAGAVSCSRLFMVVVLPMIGIAAGAHGRAPPLQPADQADQPREERRTSAIERQVFAAVPSELYVRTVRTAPDRGTGLIGHGARGAHRASARHFICWRSRPSCRSSARRRQPGQKRVRGRRRETLAHPRPLARHIGDRHQSDPARPPHATRPAPRCSRQSWSSACSRS